MPPSRGQRTHREGAILYVHGTPCQPLRNYLYPETIYSPSQMKAIAAHVQQVCFHGHTHLPGIFTLAESDNWSYQTPDELNGAYRLTDGPVLCNVGSVGQPRDCDSRACYVLFDGESIRYRRVPYEIEATIQKIHTAPNIPNLYGDRLPVGR